jgi:hypothetical protein
MQRPKLEVLVVIPFIGVAEEAPWRPARRVRERHDVLHGDQVALAAARIVGIDQELGLQRIELAVDAVELAVVPAHVRHEQADVHEAVIERLLLVEVPGVGRAHFVELQHRERRWLPALSGARVVAVAVVRERGAGAQRRGDAEDGEKTHGVLLVV